MRASEFHQNKGNGFELELKSILDDLGLKIKYQGEGPDIDFIIEEYGIGIDAKWMGTPIEEPRYRTLDGDLYAQHEVFRVWVDQIHSYIHQKEIFQLQDIYFVCKMEINGYTDYRVVSLANANNLHMLTNRTVHSSHTYNDRWDNWKRKYNSWVPIFPEESMSLEEFINQLKGGSL